MSVPPLVSVQPSFSCEVRADQLWSPLARVPATCLEAPISPLPSGGLATRVPRKPWRFVCRVGAMPLAGTLNTCLGSQKTP